MRRRLGLWLAARDDDGPLAERIAVSVNEAASNAVEHAYGLDDATYAVDATIDAGTLTIAVTDGGRWRDPRGRDGGRGLMLMRALADDVDVAPSPEGTSVTLTWHLDRVDA